jgi:putative tryptophan/tyrosine transport system substrate-binding protein
MRRREFIAGVAGAAAWPVVVGAQQSEMPVIGFLGMDESGSRRRQTSKAFEDRFREGLKAEGYIEGQNVKIDWRWANWQPAAVDAMVYELIRSQAKVIVSAGTPRAAVAAKRITSTTPIVFVFGGDPIELGLVASLNQPGGNITGVIYTTRNLEGKRLELLTEAAPQAKTIAYFSGDPNEGGIQAGLSDMLAAARLVGKEMIVFEVRRDSDIDAAFSTLVERGVGALAVGTGAILRGNLDRIVALAALHKIPAIYPFRVYALGGGLISYGGRPLDAYQPAGVYVGRILNGKKPADLPVQRSTLFELVINLKAANALGLTIPETLLAIADEVIE